MPTLSEFRVPFGRLAFTSLLADIPDSCLTKTGLEFKHTVPAMKSLEVKITYGALNDLEQITAKALSDLAAEKKAHDVSKQTLGDTKGKLCQAAINLGKNEETIRGLRSTINSAERTMNAMSCEIDKLNCQLFPTVSAYRYETEVSWCGSFRAVHARAQDVALQITDHDLRRGQYDTDYARRWADKMAKRAYDETRKAMMSAFGHEETNAGRDMRPCHCDPRRHGVGPGCCRYGQ